MSKKFYKKYIEIVKKANFKETYYNDGELNLYCGTYTTSWTDKEIKNDIIEELTRRFS